VTRDTFTVFYNWAYTGIVMDSYNKSDVDLSCLDITNIYEFVDFHVVPQSKNKALELYFMKDVKDWVVSFVNTAELYEKTPESSSLRRLHVDFLLETSDFDTWRTSLEDLPKDFVADLFDRCREREVVPGSCFGTLQKGGIAAWIKGKSINFCKMYHEHQEPESRRIIDLS
jgi:hypothetical protein